MDNNNNNVINKSLRFYDKIHDIGDTTIYTGTYNNKECIIKKIKICDILSVKSKILRELSFLKKYNHVNIIRLYDVLRYDNNILLILEKGDDDLFKLLSNNKKCDDSTDDIINALSFIESIGYVYGDLNLKNVIKMSNNKNNKKTYKIIDFGLTTKLYRTNAIHKPAQFAEPLEIKLGQKIYPEKIDSWGLGMIKYIFNYDNDKNKQELADDINYLLNDDPKQRLTILQYCSKKRDYNKLIIFNKNILKNDLSNDSHSEPEKKQQDNFRESFINMLLDFNKLNNLNLENIFITMELLEMENLNSCDDYIKNGLIFYYLSTKITSNFEIPCIDIMELINNLLTNKSNAIKSKSEFNDIIFNILIKHNWDIDVNTQFNYLGVIPKKIKNDYIDLAFLVLISDNLYKLPKKTIHNSILFIINNKQNTKLNLVKNNITVKIAEQITFAQNAILA